MDKFQLEKIISEKKLSDKVLERKNFINSHEISINKENGVTTAKVKSNIHVFQFNPKVYKDKLDNYIEEKKNEC